jgi:pyruvate carboxylase
VLGAAKKLPRRSKNERDSPLESVARDDLDKLRTELETTSAERPDEEFVLYLCPKDAGVYRIPHYGDAPLPPVWRQGLKKPGDRVNFDLWGKPYSLELVSIGAEHEGFIHVVMKVNNKTRVYTVATPRARKVEIRMARGPNDVGAPINGNIWRIGNPERGPIKVGDIVHKGEEIANLEAMKMENSILAHIDGQIAELCFKLNETVQEGQLCSLSAIGLSRMRARPGTVMSVQEHELAGSNHAIIRRAYRTMRRISSIFGVDKSVLDIICSQGS